MESYLGLLPPTVQNLPYAQLSLREFQELIQNGLNLSYAERYQLRYGTKYPSVPMTTFESDQDQYLFCAAWFYREVGYRSHLFLRTEFCLKQAIQQKDPVLVRYFYDRSEDMEGYELNLLYQAVATGVVEIVKIFKKLIRKHLDDNSIHEYLKIPNVEMFQFLREWLSYPAFWSVAARDLPLDSFSISEYPENEIDYIQGLLISEDLLKREKARRLISNLLSGDPVKNIYQYSRAFSVLCLLDDRKLFTEHWLSFKLGLADSDNAIYVLLMTCAVNFLEYLWEVEGYSFFKNYPQRGPMIILDKIATNLLITPRIPALLKWISEKLPKYKNLILVKTLAGIIGDTVFVDDQFSEEFLISLCQYKQWSTLSICLLREDNSISVDLTSENFDIFLNSNVPLNRLEIPSGIDLTYPQWEKLISRLISENQEIPPNKTGFLRYAPTNHLFSILTQLTDRIEGGICYETIMYPINQNSFRQAVISNNLEYVDHALRSPFFAKPQVMRFKTNRDLINDQMRALLKKHSIDILVREIKPSKYCVADDNLAKNS